MMNQPKAVNSYDSICCFRSNDSSMTRRLLWEITGRCNLSCAFCHRTPRMEREVTRGECEALIPFLKTLGIGGVIVSGGEPLVREDIYEILALLKGHGFDIDMCTNGTTITRDVASRLRCVLSEVSVSIDSDNALVHDSIRGRAGAWEGTVAGIRALQEEGLRVHTLSLVTVETLAGIEETVAFLYRLRVSSMGFIGQIPLHTGSNELLSEMNQEALRKTFKAIRRRYSDVAINSKQLIISSTMISCRAGRDILGLDANMMLTPCILLGRLGAIDLRKDENRTVDVLPRLRRSATLALYRGEGQGCCPGSRVTNSE